MTRTITTLLWFCATSFSAPLACWATPITVPSDLNPGDHYRLAFLTGPKQERDALSSSIKDYNVFVSGVAAGVAELAALGTTWTAIASTATVNASDNTNTNIKVWTGVPIYTLADTRIADDNKDLWDGTIASPLNIDQTGALDLYQNVWTGTSSSGVGEPSHTLGTSAPIFGASDVTSSKWVFYASDPSPGTPRAFYAISGELTVVPEPSGLALAALGLAALAACGRRRRR